jgi:hypothetical protein
MFLTASNCTSAAIVWNIFLLSPKIHQDLNTHKGDRIHLPVVFLLSITDFSFHIWYWLRNLSSELNFDPCRFYFAWTKVKV